MKNAALYNARRLESQRRSLVRNRTFVVEHLRDHPCVDCGESDPAVLDFDHIGRKFTEVSNLIRRGYGLARLKQEIERCEVRCALCHRWRTAKQFGWG